MQVREFVRRSSTSEGGGAIHLPACEAWMAFQRDRLPKLARGGEIYVFMFSPAEGM